MGQMKTARIEHHNDGLHFFSSYDAGLVSALKGNIPTVDRAWEPNGKYWIVAPQHEDELIRICQLYLNITPTITGASIQGPTTSETKLFRVEYIGQVKDRGNGELSAFGAMVKTPPVATGYTDVQYDWSVVFPESVLKNWFEGDSQKITVNQSTLYGVLAVKRDASPDTIKAAWRKQVKRFHPDINSDEDTAAMTIKINEAYEVLRNPVQRKKYDAGLRLEASLVDQSAPMRVGDFTIPIRCGLIMAQGTYKVGRFIVSEILQWHDIVENGRTLVTSWDTSTNSLVRNWI